MRDAVGRFLTTLALDAAPPRCLLCERDHTERSWLCAACAADIALNERPCERCGLPQSAPVCGQCATEPPPFTHTCAPLRYSGTLPPLIHRWKFAGEAGLTDTLVRHSWLRSVPVHPGVDVLVPVPAHWRRRWRRGFDQTWLLANSLRHHLQLDVPVRPLVRRHRATLAQRQLSAAGRTVNVTQAFVADAACVGLNIALVDDVVTTGATVTAAAESLLAAGANTVQVWCLARVDAPADTL